MINLEVCHNSHNLDYRSPFGAVPCGTKVSLRLKTVSDMTVKECILRLWEKGNREHLVKMHCRKVVEQGGKTKQYFEAEYQVPDAPGLVWYYFLIFVGDKLYYYGNNVENLGGVGELKTFAPSSYQITVYRSSRVPSWYKEGIIYQIFVDRFHRGGNTQGEKVLPTPMGLAQKKGLLHLNWYDTPFYLKDEEGQILRWTFLGGNLLGVKEKLDYLQELGVTIIYFNPIFEAVSNHKYDTGDYLKIDPMFGDEVGFHQLVAAAKERGMSIILDGVFSHTGRDSIYFNRFGSYPEVGAYQSPDSPYAKWYTFTKDCDKYDCWWGVEDLPNVDEMNPSYRYFIYGGENSVVRHWLKAGVKGWRLDVADELPDEFIKELRVAVKETDKEAVLIGEVWEDASHKVSYDKLREYFWGEELDATMNYPFRSIMLDFILGKEDAPLTYGRIMSLYENYPRENFYAAMNLIGSHDRERVLTLLGEAPDGEKLREKEKEEFRLAEPARELALRRLKVLSLIQMTFPGVPCIYYGDEAEVEGYTDPYNRGTYPWGRENKELLAWYRRITRLRNEYEVLRRGDFIPFYQGRDIYGFRRIGDGEQIIVFVNRNRKKEDKLKIDLASGSGYTGNTVKVKILDLLAGTVLESAQSLEVPPLGARVIYIKDMTKKHPSLENLPKGAGILLHITSLPSPWGVGDLGEEAYRFIDFLSSAGQTIWQILPLNPPGLGNSPYNSSSSFAGNELLLDIGHLAEEGLLGEEETRAELEKIKNKISGIGETNKISETSEVDEVNEINQISETHEIYDHTRASFQIARQSKYRLYRKAYQRFQQALKEAGAGQIEEEYKEGSEEKPKEKAFISRENYLTFQQENSFWLEDYCLYAALKEHFDDSPWNSWEQGIAERQKDALASYRAQLREEMEFHSFLQYTFFTQWQRLKDYAYGKGILILGDVPIYVSPDSCDTWVNRHLFFLDEEGRPSKVAGVPPDYFSKTGQLWGNPVYRWGEMAKDGYSWWLKRIRHGLNLYDYMRLDHFRGFEAYWAVPGGEETAEKGQWLKGPGKDFFQALEQELGNLPFIAEDLGVITPEVNNLKNIFGFPGMKIFQFSHREMIRSQGIAEDQYFEKNKEKEKEKEKENIVYYTGTHDNDTLAGWCREQGQELEKECEQKWYYRRIIEGLYQSNAAWVIIPLQDILGLGSEARMNIPGTIYGNWEWRLDRALLTDEITAWLRGLRKPGKSGL